MNEPLKLVCGGSVCELAENPPPHKAIVQRTYELACFIVAGALGGQSFRGCRHAELGHTSGNEC